MNGKGSKQRPTNLEQFRKNYDDIFRKKQSSAKPLAASVKSQKIRPYRRIEKLPATQSE